MYYIALIHQLQEYYFTCAVQMHVSFPAKTRDLGPTNSQPQYSYVSMIWVHCTRWTFFLGRAWLLGVGGPCVVAGGGMCGFSRGVCVARGGVHGFFWGACVVFGGGMCGFFGGGACVVFSGGACVVFSGGHA